MELYQIGRFLDLDILAQNCEDAIVQVLIYLILNNICSSRIWNRCWTSVAEPVEPKLFDTWSRSRNYLFHEYLLQSVLRMLG